MDSFLEAGTSVELPQHLNLHQEIGQLLDDLLPPKRTMVTLRKRRHNYIIPLVRTERFKRTFINRCLFL